MTHQLVITPGSYSDQVARMWRNAWYHVNPLDWNHMCEWLSEHHACEVLTHSGNRGFALQFKTQEHMVAFVLQWS